eukprot:maker-scaffold574_size133225-snap-gene-0.17 protein:Tk07453 transcript:maker-scaffold574_size133225-snap-gene-0.17-mRNA-1 annotation:"thrombospondin"
MSSELIDDGCDPRVYRVLDDHRRSTKYLKSSFESALCDDLLPYGWYRFLSYGMPREMATECPAGNGCGTQAQVWLNVGTNILHTGNITVDACVSWGVEEESSASQGASLSDCCLFTLPVSIQNCNGFNVYYLGPTQACSIAYCSAAVPSKNHGVTSSTDMVGYPQKSLTPPKIVFYVKRDEFYFHCKSSCQECRFGWLIKRDLDSSMLKVGSNQRVQSAKDLGLKFGDELTCVTSPYLNRQSSTKSKPFKTGISLNRDHLELRNDGSTYNLVLDQHMPLMCGPMDSNQPCQIKASFSTGPNDEVPNSVVFGQCSQTLLDASVCTLIGQRNHCNRMTLPLQVGNPFQFWNRSKVEGNLSIHLEVTSLEEASIEQTLSLPYTIQILPRLLCHLFSFGNVVTFDQILFHLATQGKFVVLKSSSNDFEILARLTQVKSNMVALTSLEVRQFDERLTLNLTLDDMETVLAINRVNFQHFTIERLQYKNALLVTASSRRTIRINYEADFLSISILGLPEDVSLSDGLCVIERLADAEEYVISPTGMIQKYAHASQWNFHSCHQNSITKSTNELAMTFHRRMKLDQTTIPLEPKETLVQHIKDDEIPRLCTDKIVNSTLAKECGPFFRHDIMISINICIRDLSTFRRTSLATATIPLMESQCAASLQTSLERPIPEDLKEILECSNPCQHVDYCFIHNCNSTANGTKDSKVSSVLCDLRESRCLLPNNIVAWKPSVVNDVSLVLQASGGGNHSWVMPLAFDRGQLGFEIPTILSDTFQDSSSIYNTTMTWNQTDLAQITFYNSSCVICQASSCSKRDDVCELEGQCLPLFAISPLNACLVCSKDGQWILENSAKNLTSVHQEVFHIMAGDRWIYRVAANLSRLISAPMSMALSEQNILEWTAPPHGANSTQVVVLELISPCGVKYLDEFILKVTRCECRNGGWCVSHGDTIQCRCPKFWSDVPCHEIPRGFLCDSCPPGFKGNGIRCTEVDPCSSNPCHPGVDCFLEEDDVGSFKCGPCPFRTRGNGTDCQAFSPCDSNPCHPDVECFPLGEDFICANCPPGFTGNGIHCTELLNGTNPCQVEATNPCFDPEMCQPNGSTVECLACPDGFKGDGIQCQPVTSNLCDSENPCHPSSSCLFVNGILTCGPCPDDMTGNGKVCHRIDRCSSNPCFEGVACSPNASWSGGFACGPCPAGMTGNGHDCNLILDFCDPNPCFRDVACVNHESGFQCARCPRGYHGNGLDCRPSLFNLCATSPCFEGVPCQTHGSTFKCGPCPPGSTGNGVECVPETPCSSNPCFPGVKCTDNLANHSFTCGSCPWGLYGNGSNCREPPHHCLSNPCYPGVQCFNFPDKFKCGNCPVGLTVKMGRMARGTPLARFSSPPTSLRRWRGREPGQGRSSSHPAHLDWKVCQVSMQNFHSQDGPDGSRNALGQVLFPSNVSTRSTRSEAGVVSPHLPYAANTLVDNAIALWNKFPALREASTKRMASNKSQFPTKWIYPQRNEKSNKMMSNVQGQQYYSEQLFCHPFQMMPSSMFQSDDQKQDAIYIPESISPWSEIISKYLNGTAPSQRRHFKSRSKYHQSGHKCKSGNGLGMLTNGGPMHQFLHSRTSGGNNLSVHHSRVSAGHPMSFSPPPIRRTSSGVSKFSPSMGTSRM